MIPLRKKREVGPARDFSRRSRDFARGDWDLNEPQAFRNIARSPVELAAVTGILIRIFRALIFTHGPIDSPVYYGGALLLGGVFLLTMATLHIGRFPITEWPWRGAVFAVVETCAEMATSLGLIRLHKEPWGTVRAELHDWQPMARGVLFWRLLVITVFALLLAGVVHLVRKKLVRDDGEYSGSEDRRERSML